MSLKTPIIASPSSGQEELVSLLTRRKEIREAIRSRVRANPLEFYWPHAYGCDGTKCWKIENEHTDAFGLKYKVKGCPQYFFHTSLADVRAYFGANRAGKTTALVVEILFHLTGMYPDWYPRKRRYNRPTKGRVVASDFKKAVGEVITPALEDWIPPHTLLDRDKNPQGIYDKYYIKHFLGGVSKFDIITSEQDVSVAEGYSGDFVAYDEPPPRPHRIACARGLIDRKGWEIFSLTPLKEPWLYDDVFAPGNKIC